MERRRLLRAGRSAAIARRNLRGRVWSVSGRLFSVQGLKHAHATIVEATATVFGRGSGPLTGPAAAQADSALRGSMARGVAAKGRGPLPIRWGL